MEAEVVEVGSVSENESQQEAVQEAERACDPSFCPARCPLSSGRPFHGTSESRLSFLPAGSRSGPACAAALFLQIQAMQLWLRLKALFEKIHVLDNFKQPTLNSWGENRRVTRDNGTGTHAVPTPATAGVSMALWARPTPIGEICATKIFSFNNIETRKSFQFT